MLFTTISQYPLYQYRPFYIPPKHRYIFDMWNIIDWLFFIITLSYLLTIHKNLNSDADKVGGTLLMIVMYYRSFSYLRVLDAFTALVGIINIIFGELMVFVFLLFYFYFATALLLIKLDPESSVKMNMINAYYWTLFGGIDDQAFTNFRFAALAVIFGTLIVSVVLLNVLIAFLSNLFSRLEAQQMVNDLKERAGLIMDLEVMVMFFRYKIFGTLKKREKMIETEFDFTKGPQNPHIELLKDTRLKKYYSQENFLYVFKTMDFDQDKDDETLDEHILKMVKDLGAKVGELQQKQLGLEKLGIRQNKALGQKLDYVISMFKDRPVGARSQFRV